MQHGEERKLVTVLFADIVGSTALAGEEDPERVRMRLERFYEAMSEEIERTGGTVEKFAGDAVMAAFGAPIALEDHAERALHAALSMQHRLAELGDGLRLRIGVNTGEVVVGQPRESSSFVAGDAVNVGARLEQAAAPGEILAGERTVAAAGGAFEFGGARRVEAKGKPEGVVGRPVLRALSLARPRRAGGFRRVFVGRDSELELLLATFRRAVSQGEPHLVTIVGAPGVGKTRLVRELWEVLALEDPAPLRRTGRCLPYGDGITYWPLGEMLREHFGILESDAPEDVRSRLGERAILGLALGLDVAGTAHPLDARERLHAAVVGFVDQELAKDCPAVVLVEDIHWAEDDLLDLLERISRDGRAPVVLLTTARPELFAHRPTWSGGRRNATTMWLEPLAVDETSRLLAELLAAEVPAELRQLVVERAEGNPFFVEELLGSLVEAGVLERDGDVWRANQLPVGFSMPDSVHAVLAARIDRLPAAEKEALQAASVVGRSFWPGAISHLLGVGEPDFDLLEARDFIRRSGRSSLAGEREYAIKHALTREVAYASIPKARRGRLHAALASWLEGWDRDPDERATLLAYHYSEAVRPEDADLVWGDAVSERDRVRATGVRWLRRAGELARGRYEMEEAIELFERAIELCDDDHERALLLRELGEAHALRYDGYAMRKTLLQALEGPLDDVERAETLAFLAFQTSIRSSMWSIRLDRSLIVEWAGRALALAPAGSDSEVRALVARGNVEPAQVADDELARISRLAEDLGDVPLWSHALGVRCSAAFDQLKFAEAYAWSERRLELIAGVDDPDHLCEAYESGAPAALAVSRFDEARRLATVHEELARRLSPHHRVHSVSLGLLVDEVIAAWNAVVTQTPSVVAAIEDNLATPCVRNPHGLLLLALAHLCIADEARAEELTRDAERVAGEGYDRYFTGPRLRAALERGDRAAAEAQLELQPDRAFVWGPGVFSARLDGLVAVRDASRVEREASDLLQAGTYLEPFALRALGWARGDDDLLARADECFAELGLGWHRAQTERLLAGL